MTPVSEALLYEGIRGSGINGSDMVGSKYANNSSHVSKGTNAQSAKNRSVSRKKVGKK